MPHTDLSWRTTRPAEGFYTSEVQTPDRWPVRSFLPTGYEPNYPYPPLVFFHGHGGCAEPILRLAARCCGCRKCGSSASSSATASPTPTCRWPWPSATTASSTPPACRYACTPTRPPTASTPTCSATSTAG